MITNNCDQFKYNFRIIIFLKMGGDRGNSGPTVVDYDIRPTCEE